MVLRNTVFLKQMWPIIILWGSFPQKKKKIHSISEEPSLSNLIQMPYLEVEICRALWVISEHA